MGELSRLTDSANQLLQVRDEIASMKESLKSMEALETKLCEVDIPEIMDEVGVTEFKLADGRVISLDELLFCSISKANEDAAFKWLRDNEHDSIIKRIITIGFGKGEDDKAQDIFQELVDHVELSDNDISSKESIHHSTLKSFVKGQLQEGEEFPMELFGVHQKLVAKVGSTKARGKKKR